MNEELVRDIELELPELAIPIQTVSGSGAYAPLEEKIRIENAPYFVDSNPEAGYDPI